MSEPDAPQSDSHPPRRGRPPKGSASSAPESKSWPTWYSTRNAFNEGLKEDGRWPDYLKRREALKKLHTVEEACRLAAWEFPPLPESLAPGIEREEPADDDEQAESGAAIFRPTTAADFAGKPKCSPAVEIEWVGNNYSRNDVTPKEAPSGAAWNMLIFVRRHAKGAEIFWGRLFPETMPSQKDLAAGNRYADRGALIFDALELVVEARRLEREDDERQRAAGKLPPDNSSTGTIDFPPPASAPNNGQNSRVW